jgi:hypothetical protein
MKVPPIPLDMDAARAAIAKIGAIDLRSVTIEELLDLVTPVFQGLAVSAPRFDPGIELYRGRRTDRPETLKDLLYPPAHKTPIGRANRASQPVLYCSTARAGALCEVEPNAGDIVAITRLKTTQPLLVNHVGYARRAFEVLGSSRAIPSWSGEPVKVPALPGMKELHDYLATTFAQVIPLSESHRYKLTIALAEKLFAHDLFDALLYPTVAMRANADNLVLKTRFADSSLRFEYVELLRIKSAAGLRFEIDVIDSARSIDAAGKIEWRGRAPGWKIPSGGELSFTAEGGRWVARDLKGNIVEQD